MNIDQIRKQAKINLTLEQRVDFICDMDEVRLLIPALKTLFVRMNPAVEVQVTHGADELGKDLTIIRRDNLTTDVIAVVVKRGHISGKTRSHVDQLKSDILSLNAAEKRAYEEIVSQANQAEHHNASVDTRVKAMPVTAIWICLAGRLSKHARLRLDLEVTKLVKEVWDVSWLEEKFTEFYPEVYFDAETITIISALISRFERTHHLVKVGGDKPLSDYFVDPLVSTIDLPNIFNSDSQNETTSIERLALRKKLPFSSLSQAVTSKKRILLTGDPGSGKSGALAKIALDLCKAAQVIVAADKSSVLISDIRLPILIHAAMDLMPLFRDAPIA